MERSFLCHPDRRLPKRRDRGASARRNHRSLKQQRRFKDPEQNEASRGSNFRGSYRITSGPRLSFARQTPFTRAAARVTS